MFEPKSIDDIVFKSKTEAAKIFDITKNGKPFPVSGVNGILLHGVYGTGKTALAKLLPDEIEKAKGGVEAYEEFVTCTAGDNGVQLLQKISKQAQLVQIYNRSGNHYFVMDEVDLLTETAMKQLKGLMNLPNTVYIMTTNCLSKIDKGVINRSIVVDFNAADAHQWLPLAHKILKQRNAGTVSDSHILKIIEACDGSARQIIDAISSVAARKRREKMRLISS